MAGTRTAGGPIQWVRWSIVLVGVLCIAAGIIVLATPGISLTTLAVVTGIFLVADGVGDLFVAGFRAGERDTLVVLIGVAGVVVGILLIRHPLAGVVAAALLLGLWLIIAGVVRAGAAIAEHHRPMWNSIIAAVEIIGGVIIVSSPHIGVAALALVIGVTLVVRGAVLVAAGWFIDRLIRHARPSPTGPVPTT